MDSMVGQPMPLLLPFRVAETAKSRILICEKPDGRAELDKRHLPVSTGGGQRAPDNCEVVKEKVTDRRARRRYNIPMRAIVNLSRGSNRLTGSALVLNISSQGVAFTTQLPIGLEESLALDLEWPVRLDGECPLHLKLNVVAIRTQDNGVVAARITGYEMRTGVGPRPLQSPQWLFTVAG